MYDSLIATALKSQANIGKSFQSFFIETMELFLTHTGRLNFTRMARCGRSCESRFRQNFKKPFDWFSFNRTFLEQTMGHRIAIAKAFASQQRMDLSVGSTKTLLHKSAMVERFISMSGKHADMRFNNTDRVSRRKRFTFAAHPPPFDGYVGKTKKHLRRRCFL